MSLDAGTVTVAADGSFSGSGLSLALMNQRVITLDAQWAYSPASQAMYDAHKAEIRRALAQSCIDDATALIGYLTANASVSVPGASTGSSTLTGTIT